MILEFTACYKIDFKLLSTLLNDKKKNKKIIKIWSKKID